MQSDSETNVSNVSGYIRYNDKNLKLLYTSMIRNMEALNQNLLDIERNLKSIVSQAGSLEGHLRSLLQSLPKPNIPADHMDTTSGYKQRLIEDPRAAASCWTDCKSYAKKNCAFELHRRRPKQALIIMAMLDCRPKSPNRADAIALALRPKPVYSSGVLIGNWVEDRIECPKGGTFYFPPKDDSATSTLKPESRQPDFKINKLNNTQGNVSNLMRHDSHAVCPNYASTIDVVYKHLPKPLCGPQQRYYKRAAHIYYPQPDLMQCFGNLSEWGLRKYKQYEWACTDVSDYASSLYDDTYLTPQLNQYLSRCERKARDSKFTSSFRYKMTKPVAQLKKKQ